MSGSPFTKYLENYAEAESRNSQLENIPVSDAIMVIPAYRETTEFLHRLCKQTFSGTKNILLILVSNHPTGLSSDTLASALQHHKNLTSALPPPDWQSSNLSFHRGKGVDVLLVHKVGNESLDAKQSTGLARKIGADIAISLFQKELCKLHWIFNTDADAHLPRDYFLSATSVQKDAAGILFPFSHTGPAGKVTEVTKIYEKRLFEYVTGLRSAGSPYAFHTLGSAVAVNPESYVKIRGFPRRNAGEDFYLINKLAKVGKIISLDAPTIILDSRYSDRVPFGTGPAVRALAESNSPYQEKIFYHPQVFKHLGLFIHAFENEIDKTSPIDVPTEVYETAQKIGIDSFFSHAKSQNLKGEKYRRHFHVWFDGFRTLKFLHYLRDSYFPNLSNEEFENESETN